MGNLGGSGLGGGVTSGGAITSFSDPTDFDTSSAGIGDDAGSLAPNSLDEKSTRRERKLTPQQTEALLQRIRTRFRFMVTGSKAIRDAGAKDMTALGPDGPIDPLERTARILLQRPVVHLDQLNQHVNTLVNQFRSAPLGVKVIPKGNGANDKTASLRGDRIRAIEHESNAPQAYETALRCAAERGYGVITLETEEISHDSFDQRVVIVREPNPDCVYYDPMCRKADFSDMQDGVKVWSMPMDEFKRKYPWATITDFSVEHQLLAPDWIDIDKQTVQVGRYSYFENDERYLYLIDDGSPSGQSIYKDELPKGAKVSKGHIKYEGQQYKILNEKKSVKREVWQCTTNGVEILDDTPWTGCRIPIFPMIGKEKFLLINGKLERVWESYIRNAIDGQRAFDAAATNEVEAANMVPKITYMMFEGQEDTATDWENINKIPTPYALVKPIVDAATGAVLGLPQRQGYEPPIQAMEIMKEASKRAMQAAIGSHGFTITDDTHVQSGKAVNSLKQQTDVGAFHFHANGRVTIQAVLTEINYMLDKVEDTDRQVSLTAEDGTHRMERINAPHKDKSGRVVEHRYNARDEQTGKPVEDAAHQVIITTGPSVESQREEAAKVSAELLNTPFGIKIADLAIKSMNLGTYGEQMAERVIPPEFAQKDGEPDIPPQIKQHVAQLQQQNQQMQQGIQQLLHEREAKTAEIRSKVEIEKIKADLQIELQKMKDATSLAVAGLAQKGQFLETHEKLTHNEEMALAEQRHEAEQAALAHSRQLQQSQVATDQQAQLSAQGHEQTLDQQGQAAEAAAQQQQMAAEQPATTA